MWQGGSGSAAQIAALQKNVAEQDQRCTELEVCLQACGTQTSYSYVLQALVCSVCMHRTPQVTMSDQGMQCTVLRFYKGSCWLVHLVLLVIQAIGLAFQLGLAGHLAASMPLHVALWVV